MSCTKRDKSSGGAATHLALRGGWRVISHCRLGARRCRHAGFNLVEVLIAMFIFGLGVIQVLAMFPVAIYSGAQAVNQVEGHLLGQTAQAILLYEMNTTLFSAMATAASNYAYIESATPLGGDNRWQVAFNYLYSPPALPSEERWGYSHYYVTIVSGRCAGETRRITGNTSTRLNVSPNWTDAPDATSRFRITRYALPGPRYEGMAADTSTTTTIQAMPAPAWTTDVWKGYTVQIVAGTNKGLCRTISGNDSDTLQLATNLPVAPDTTSKFRILPPVGIVREARVSSFSTAARTITAEYLPGHTSAGQAVAEWPANHWQDCYVLMLDGRARGKAYPIESNDTNGRLVISDDGVAGSVNFEKDGLARGDRFFIAGHRNPDFPRTIPHDRFRRLDNSNPNVFVAARQTAASPLHLDCLNPLYDAALAARYVERGKAFPLDREYSYVIILSDQAGDSRTGSQRTGASEPGARADILVFFNYQELQPPARNRPAVAHFIYEQRE